MENPTIKVFSGASDESRNAKALLSSRGTVELSDEENRPRNSQGELFKGIISGVSIPSRIQIPERRRERPCDQCRRRKSRCVIHVNETVCVLCDFHKQECTFTVPIKREGSTKTTDHKEAEQAKQNLLPDDDHAHLGRSLSCNHKALELGKDLPKVQSAYSHTQTARGGTFVGVRLPQTWQATEQQIPEEPIARPFSSTSTDDSWLGRGYTNSSPKGSSKRHLCPYCSTEFSQHQNLKKHLLRHSKKPYECSSCQSSFRTLNDLERHSKLHTRERPHECPKCGRKFARGEALARHNEGPGGCTGQRSSLNLGQDGLENLADSSTGATTAQTTRISLLFTSHSRNNRSNGLEQHDVAHTRQSSPAEDPLDQAKHDLEELRPGYWESPANVDLPHEPTAPFQAPQDAIVTVAAEPSITASIEVSESDNTCNSKAVTDSGYGSANFQAQPRKAIETDLDGSGDDAATVYTSLSAGLEQGAQEYIHQLVSDLSRHLPFGDHDLWKVVADLPNRLADFALRLGYDGAEKRSLTAMTFIHRHRSAITEHFREAHLNDTDSTGQSAAKTMDMGFDEKIQAWLKNLGESQDIPQACNEIWDDPTIAMDDLESADTLLNPTSDDYRTYVQQSRAYQWLIANLRRDCFTSPAQDDSMKAIRDAVLEHLPAVRQLSRKAPPPKSKAEFLLQWNPWDFFQAQRYDTTPDQALLHAITITATSSSHAQCHPCLAYVKLMWPSVGEGVLLAISSSLKANTSSSISMSHLATLQIARLKSVGYKANRRSAQLPHGTSIAITITHKARLNVKLEGSRDAIAEIAEMLGWLVTAFCSTPANPGITYAKPVAYRVASRHGGTDLRSESAIPQIVIDSEPVEKEKVPAVPSAQCWYDLFRHPVVVFGYPIIRRADNQPGLEIPLNIATALMQERTIQEFDGSCFIKAYNALIAPMKVSRDVVLWHLFLNEDGQRISYNDAKDHQDLSIHDLEKHRHIIGWCSDFAYHAGSPTASYNIRRTDLPRPHAGCLLEKATIGLGAKGLTGGLEFRVGVRDQSVKIVRIGYRHRLEWISEKSFVFWDEDEKRGWLINGCSALLHLVRASFVTKRRGKLASTCLLDHTKLEVGTDVHGVESAVDVLLNKRNRSMVVYADEEDEDKDEDEQIGDLKLHNRGGMSEAGRYTFETRVTEIQIALEKLVDQQYAAEERSGIALSVRTRKYLEGWDFAQVALQNDPLVPKVATLSATGKGWVDLAHSIHAVTLFGNGFGDLIAPTGQNDLCGYWSSLPRQEYYLAATQEDLKFIAERQGNPDSYPMQLADNIYWHDTSTMHKCKCVGGPNDSLVREWSRKLHGRTSKHMELAQLLLPSKTSSQGKSQMYSHRAVVFGHNRDYPWRFKDCGAPELGEISEDEPERIATPAFSSSSSSSLPSADQSTLLATQSSSTDATSIDDVQASEALNDSSGDKDSSTGEGASNVVSGKKRRREAESDDGMAVRLKRIKTMWRGSSS